MRVPLSLIFAVMLWHAPLQCSHEPPPELRRYETPPEVLYDLATRFKAQGDERAYRDTLRYLVERFPSSRFAVRAKDELEPSNDDSATSTAGGSRGQGAAR